MNLKLLRTYGLLNLILLTYISGYEVLKETIRREGFERILKDFEKHYIHMRNVINDTSLCLKFYDVMRGDTYATYLGDISNNVLKVLYEMKSDEGNVLNNPLQTSIIKVPHHGSSWGPYLKELMNNAKFIFIPWCTCMYRTRKIRINPELARKCLSCSKACYTSEQLIDARMNYVSKHFMYRVYD